MQCSMCCLIEAQLQTRQAGCVRKDESDRMVLLVREEKQQDSKNTTHRNRRREQIESIEMKCREHQRLNAKNKPQHQCSGRWRACKRREAITCTPTLSTRKTISRLSINISLMQAFERRKHEKRSDLSFLYSLPQPSGHVHFSSAVICDTFLRMRFVEPSFDSFGFSSLGFAVEEAEDDEEEGADEEAAASDFASVACKMRGVKRQNKHNANRSSRSRSRRFELAFLQMRCDRARTAKMEETKRNRFDMAVCKKCRSLEANSTNRMCTGTWRNTKPVKMRTKRWNCEARLESNQRRNKTTLLKTQKARQSSAQNPGSKTETHLNFLYSLPQPCGQVHFSSGASSEMLRRLRFFAPCFGLALAVDLVEDEDEEVEEANAAERIDLESRLIGSLGSEEFDDEEEAAEEEDADEVEEFPADFVSVACSTRKSGQSKQRRREPEQQKRQLLDLAPLCNSPRAPRSKHGCRKERENEFSTSKRDNKPSRAQTCKSASQITLFCDIVCRSLSGKSSGLLVGNQ